MTDKVLKFPVSSRLRPNNSIQHEERQATLFSQWNKGSHHFVILNPAKSNQEILSKIFVRNGISCVFDFRSKPIFEKPFFDHKEIICYLSKLNIPYYDAAYFAHKSSLGEDIFDCPAIRSALNDGLSAGLVLIITNDQLIRDVDNGKVRRAMHKIDPNVIEINPSSVLS